MIGEALAAVTAGLKGAGIKSTGPDAAKVNLPGAWVMLDGITDETLSGRASTVRVRVYLIARETGVAKSYEQLDGLLDKAYESGFGPDVDVAPAAVVMPDQVTYPALTYTVDTDA